MGYLVFLLLNLATAEPRFINGLYTNSYGNPNGRGILFLHGGPGYNSASFEVAAAEDLSNQGYFVVTFDQRGGGRSASAPHDWYNFINATADVDTIAKAYNLRNFLLLGHSYGGTLALKYAALKRNPEIRAILLMDAPVDQIALLAAILDNCEMHFVNLKNDDLLELVRELRNELFIPNKPLHMNFLLGGLVFEYATICGLYGPKTSNPDRDEILKRLKALHQWISPTPLRGFVENEAWLTGNTNSEINQFNQKIFFVAGTDDGLFRLTDLNLIKASLLPGHFRMITGAGHLIFADQRQEFLKAVNWVDLLAP